MELLFDLTGYLSVVLRGCVVAAQTATLGSIVFLLALARPLAPELGPAGRDLADGAARIGAWAALALAASGLAKLALQGALLAETVDLSLAQVLGANFALAGLAQMAAAVALAVVLRALGGAAPAWGLVPPALVLLLASISTTHAMARMDGRAAMLLASFLHQAGAAVWLGGLPCFLAALRRLDGQPGWRMVSARYSQLAIAGVALILAGVAAFALAYIGSWQGLYGTAYGVMSGAKSAMLGLLLLLGLGNFLLIRGALAGGAGPVLRLRRFVEAEIGIGLAVLFAAASITSVPPSVDLPNDQVTWAELVERNTPRWPRLQSPDHDALAIPALQAQLDAAARAGAAGGPPSRPARGSCRHAMPRISPGPSTTITGRDFLWFCSACWRCWNAPVCARRGIGRWCFCCWPASCCCGPIPKCGRWARSGSGKACATWRWCSTGWRRCWWWRSRCLNGGCAPAA